MLVKNIGIIIKPFLNFVAWFLNLSKYNVYHLANGPLKESIAQANKFIYAYEHIHTSIRIAKSLNRSGNVIIDVGGGSATTTKIFSEKMPNHLIYVFEPIPQNYDIISKSKKDANANWKVINKALGNQVGTTQMYIAQNITSSSLMELRHEEFSGEYAILHEEKDKIDIEISTLDKEIPNNALIDILKLDVQGFELEVLKGGEQTLLRTNVVIFEVNNHRGFLNAPSYFELDEYMRSQKFELYDLFPNHRENEKLQDWDVIYVKKIVEK